METCLEVKNGFQNGKQRYRCKSCGKNYQKEYRYHSYWPKTDESISRLLCEGVSIRGIARLLNISKNTVLSRMLKMAKALKRPVWTIPGRSFQMDEVWTYIQNKRYGATYITYVLEQSSGKVVDFVLGQRSYKNIGPLVKSLLKTDPQTICTDKLPIYSSLIPRTKHKVFKYVTNKIERNNLTLRTHIKRLTRRTICYSKSGECLKAHLKIYFWGRDGHLTY